MKKQKEGPLFCQLLWKFNIEGRKVSKMKVKMVCTRDQETKVVDLPMSEEDLLKIRATVLDRDSTGYIAGADVKCYDETDNEIENIFEFNKSLQ